MATRKKAARPRPPTKQDAGKAAYTASSVRVYHDWNPVKLRQVERLAEAGSLGQAATVCDWLMGDDRVAGALGARTDALMGLTPSFEQGTGRRSKQAIKALEAGEDYWQAYPESQLTQMLNWGILLGISPTQQKPWTAHPDHGGRLLPTLDVWHPQSLSLNWQRRVWQMRDASGTEFDVDTTSGEWLLHTPYGPNRPWAYGLWRSLARWVLLKQYAINDFGDLGGKGTILVATAPESATKDQRKMLASDLTKAIEDRNVALANGFDLKLIEMSANSREIYQAQIDMADAAIAIRIRGGNLSTNVGKGAGSRAATEAQQRTGDDAKKRFDASSLTATLHDQSLVFWSTFNYGDPRLAPWPVYPVEPEEDKSARATMVNTLGDGLKKFRELGWKLDEKAVVEEFGLTFLGEYEEREPAPAPAPAPVPGKPDPDDDDQGDDNDDQDKGAEGRSRRLGSGARAAANSGFIDGQGYADKLVESGTRDGAAELAFDLEQVLGLIDSVQSLGELEEKLTELYANLDPERLQEVIERYVMLAELAGRAAALQDT